MTGLWEVSSLFVCLMLSKINAVTSIIYVESGKSVIINPNIQGNPEEISWRFNGNKLAECDLTDLQDYGQFKGRSEIEITTGQLTVGNMTSRDSGTYVSEIQIVGKPQVETSQHQVQVIDAVQQPNVSCKLNKTSESKTLICSESSHSQNVSYEWTGSNSAHRFGQELQISQDAEPDSVYMCTARNPVSQKSTSITLRSCSTDQTGQNVILYIILGVIGAIGVGIVTFLCIRQRKKDLRRAGVNTEDDRDDSFEGSQLHLSNTRNTSNTLHVNQEDQAFIQPVEVRGHVSNEEDDDDDDDDDDDNDDEDEDTDRKKDDELENNSKERKTEDEDDEKNEGLEKGDSENTNETSGHADEPTEAGGDADAEDEDEQDNNDGRSDDGPDD